jgi:tetratricopeptide (TPR) repeat protein
MLKKVLLLCIITVALFAKTSTIKDIYLKSYNYEKMGKYDEAIKVLTPIYEKYPKGYTLNLRLGYLFLLSKHYTNAINYYKKASIIAPSSLEPRLALTRINLILEQYEDAQTLAFNILKIDYYNFYGNLYASSALIAQKKYNTALLITNKMLTLNPTSVIYLQQLARIYKLTKNKYLNDIYNSIKILDPNNIYVNSQLKQ